MSDVHIDEDRLRAERRAVETLYRAFSEKNPDLLDRALSPGWIDIPAHPGQGPGAEDFKPVLRNIIAAFPDMQVVIHDLVSVPGRIAVRSELTGTHRGELFGIAPTGRAVRLRMHDFHALDGQRITSTWHLEDWFDLFQQIGQFPASHS